MELCACLRDTIDLRDRVRCHFVTVRVEILHLAIVCPFMRDVKRRRDWTSVRILTTIFEQIAVKRFVKVVHGIVESEQNDLRRLLGRNTTCTSQLYRVARDRVDCRVAFSERTRLMIVEVTLLFNWDQQAENRHQDRRTTNLTPTFIHDTTDKINRTIHGCPFRRKRETVLDNFARRLRSSTTAFCTFARAT